MIQNIKQKRFSFLCAYLNPVLKKPFYLYSQQSNSKSYIAKLENRSLLVLHGPETYKLLQGLTTNDINLLSSKPIKSYKGTHVQQPPTPSVQLSSRVSLYTLFLSPKGKLITDAFIYKPKMYQNGKKLFRQDQLWIDVHSSLKRELFFHLKKYLWKKQVELIDLDTENDSHKPSIYVGFNHISTVSSYLNRGSEIQSKDEKGEDDEYANLMMFDPRGGNYGRRIICMQQELGIPTKDFSLVPESKYEDFERTIGFTPSPLVTNKLPFQFNFDLMDAISFKKGCYLGQQIVSRSYFTGIVRRRVFPFLVNDENTLTENKLKEIKEGAKLINQQNEEIGKIIYYKKGETGLALAPYLNYFPQISEPQTDSRAPGQGQVTISAQKLRAKMLNIKIKSPFDGVMFCPFHLQLENYINETRKKQKNLQELDI